METDLLTFEKTYGTLDQVKETMRLKRDGIMDKVRKMRDSKIGIRKNSLKTLDDNVCQIELETRRDNRFARDYLKIARYNMLKISLERTVSDITKDYSFAYEKEEKNKDISENKVKPVITSSGSRSVSQDRRPDPRTALSSGSPSSKQTENLVAKTPRTSIETSNIDPEMASMMAMITRDENKLEPIESYYDMISSDNELQEEKRKFEELLSLIDKTLKSNFYTLMDTREKMYMANMKKKMFKITRTRGNRDETASQN